MGDDFPYIWRWGKWPATGWRCGPPWENLRKGLRCRVVVRGKTKNSALIEFRDGYRMVASRNGLRGYGMSKIEWTDEAWNPVAGRVNLVPDALDKPLRWRKPRRIFVNSMSDLFHPDVPFEYIDKVFAVMALCPQHSFQVLTKRPERMVEYFADESRSDMISMYMLAEIDERVDPLNRRSDDLRACALDVDGGDWPLPNVHLGVSVENQETANKRIPWLLKTHAAVRWVSYEPALGPVEFKFIGCPNCGESENQWYPHYTICRACGVEVKSPPDTRIDGIVMGGGARPMHPDWVRSVRDQCQEAGVPFFFRQWGDWFPEPLVGAANGCFVGDQFTTDIPWNPARHNALCMARVGKKAAGRVLDGRTWDELPGQVVARR